MKDSIPSIKRYEQRKAMIAILDSLKDQGVISQTQIQDTSGPGEIADVGKDCWGTPFRCEIKSDSISIRSAGADKKFNTIDDLQCLSGK